MDRPWRAGVDSAAAGLRTEVDVRFDIVAVALAFAALFHLAGNVRPGFLIGGATLPVAHVALGVAAAVAIAVPRMRAVALASMCVLVPLSAWLEAPIIGNHWVLAAALCMTALMAMAGSVRRRDGATMLDRATWWTAFAPAGRLVIVIAYGFAAFAKLNADFFDPAVSCAVYYQDQLVSSWGLSVLSASGRPVVGMASAVAAATVELAVPLLLAIRRTRRIGLMLALSFHWLLAMDLSQHFWDFTAVLFAGFLLFADPPLAAWIDRGVRRARDQLRPLARTTVVTLAAVAAVLAVAPHVAPASPLLRGLATLAGHAVWITAGTAILLLVVVGCLKARAEPVPSALRITAPVMALVPALVLLNGLTPYLEVKTGFGWNMYSNLRTVDGETNHFLVPATWDLTGLQADTAEILDASQEGVARLGRDGYVIAYSELREYAHQFPDERVAYRHQGEVHDASRMGDDPAGSGGVSTVSHRLQSFRAIDESGDERCLTSFSPAR